MRHLFLMLILSGSLCGAPLITLSPAGGTIAGVPGDIIGWGFTLTSDDTFWLLITNVQTDVSAIGSYQDYLSNWMATNSFALAPNAAAFSQAFVSGLTGLAAVTLNNNAPLGIFFGTFTVSYELFDADPFLGGSTQSAGDLSATFQVDVTAPTAQLPEPGSVLLVAAGLAAAALARRRV